MSTKSSFVCRIFGFIVKTVTDTALAVLSKGHWSWREEHHFFYGVLDKRKIPPVILSYSINKTQQRKMEKRERTSSFEVSHHIFLCIVITVSEEKGTANSLSAYLSIARTALSCVPSLFNSLALSYRIPCYSWDGLEHIIGSTSYGKKSLLTSSCNSRCSFPCNNKNGKFPPFI